MCGMQALLDVNKLAHSRWWHTRKVMAVSPRGGDTPMGDGGSWVPKCGIFYCYAPFRRADWMRYYYVVRNYFRLRTISI